MLNFHAGSLEKTFAVFNIPSRPSPLRGETDLFAVESLCIIIASYLAPENLPNEIGDYAPVILRIPPGLTGWWQVMGRQNTTFEQRLRLDEEHQQLVAMDGFLYPDENGLGGSGWEGGVDENQTGGKGGRGAGGMEAVDFREDTVIIEL